MCKCLFIYAMLVLLSITKICAQDYSASSIPDSLKENAHCVIREFSREVELSSINSSVERDTKVFTILDRDGDDMARFVIPYSKNSSVNIKQVILYDSQGKTIKKVKQSEISDGPAFGEFELYSDNRIKYFKPGYAEYPYSI
jgi:hypothetical protein